MLGELFVIICAELILLVSIAAMSLHGRRLDVLSGRYFGNDAGQAVSPEWSIGRLRLWVAPRRLKMLIRASQTGASGLSVPTGRNRIAEAVSPDEPGSRSSIVSGPHEVDDHAALAIASQPPPITGAMGRG